MDDQLPHCAIEAIEHPALAEGVRGLLGATCETVYLVADMPTLIEGVMKLVPDVIILELALAGGAFPQIRSEIRKLSPEALVIVISPHDQASTARLLLDGGADAVILHRTIGRDLFNAIDAFFLRGEKFVSADFGLDLFHQAAVEIGRPR